MASRRAAKRNVKAPGVKAPRKLIKKAPRGQSRALRSAAKKDCRPGSGVCEIKDIALVGGSAVHLVTVTDENKAQLVDSRPLEHLRNHCLHAGRAEGLTCTGCNKSFSSAHNAFSHAVCPRKHYRCVVCESEVTTLANFKKHCKGEIDLASCDVEKLT